MIYLAVVPAFVVGFLVGLFSFRVKSRWCPDCGAITSAFRPPKPGGQTNQGRF